MLPAMRTPLLLALLLLLPSTSHAFKSLTCDSQGSPVADGDYRRLNIVRGAAGKYEARISYRSAARETPAIDVQNARVGTELECNSIGLEFNSFQCVDKDRGNNVFAVLKREYQAFQGFPKVRILDRLEVRVITSAAEKLPASFRKKFVQGRELSLSFDQQELPCKVVN